MRILLVEDHPDLAELYAAVLKREGHTVTVARSVTAAKEACATGPFDLLIADAGLPDGDGRSVMSTLSANGPVRGIVISALTHVEDIIESVSAGFEWHLAKPVSVELLAEAVASTATGVRRVELIAEAARSSAATSSRSADA